MSKIISYLKDDDGASAVEYALLVAIIGSALAVAAILLGPAIGNALDVTANCINAGTSATKASCG
jgi:pilus assembly protein Flp/PilA